MTGNTASSSFRPGDKVLYCTGGEDAPVRGTVAKVESSPGKSCFELAISAIASGGRRRSFDQWRSNICLAWRDLCDLFAKRVSQLSTHLCFSCHPLCVHCHALAQISALSAYHNMLSCHAKPSHHTKLQNSSSDWQPQTNAHCHVLAECLQGLETPMLWRSARALSVQGRQTLHTSMSQVLGCGGSLCPRISHGKPQ